MKCSKCNKDLSIDYTISWETNPPKYYCLSCENSGVSHYYKVDVYKDSQFIQEESYIRYNLVNK